MIELATFLWFSTITAINAIEEPTKVYTFTCQQNHAVIELNMLAPISASQSELKQQSSQICLELYGPQTSTIETPSE